MSAEKSKMTYERGVSENILRSCADLIERYKGVKCAERIWFTKRTASWSCQIYSGDLDKSLCAVGKGWDVFDSVESFRKNLLRYFEDELQPHSSFTNLFEIVKILDRREKLERNDVGALVDNDVEYDYQPMADEFLGQKEVRELTEGLSSLLKKFNDLCDKNGVES